METISLVGASGNKLVADRFGTSERRTVIFTHGGGQTRHSWYAAAKRLADLGWCAICYDQRGHGKSEWVQDERYSFFDFAEDLKSVTKQVGELSGEKPISVGASLGGISTLLVCKESEEIFSSVVLVDVTPTMKQEGVARIQSFMQDKMTEGFASLEEVAAAVQLFNPNRKRSINLEGLRKNVRLDEDGRYRWHWDPNFWQGKRPIGTDRDLVQQTLIDSAKNLTIPCLLVRGQESELVGEEEADQFLKLVPHAEFADISGAGHMVAGDKNDIFIEAVERFLQPLQKESV